MNDVFISYSRRDKVFAEKLCEAFKADKREVWADWEDIPTGSDWFAEIKEGIEQSQTVVFILSPEWIKSKECAKELAYALQMGKRLIPILYIMVDPKEVPPELAKINWVYMRDTDTFDAAFKALCSTIDTDLEWIKAHTRLQVRAVEWDAKKRDLSFALHGQDLTDGEQFLASAANKSPVPTALQSEYIIASRKGESVRQRNILIGVITALVISIALGVVAIFQWKEAGTQARISRANALSALALSEKDAHYDLAILLGIEGYKTLENVRTRGTLLTLADLHPGLDRYLSVNDGSVSSIDISSNGKLFASGSWDNTVVLWNAETYQPIEEPLRGHTDKVTSVAFSPNNKLLASGSWDKTILLWDVETHQQIGQPLAGHSEPVTSLVFSGDGKYLASGSEDSTFILWDLSNPNAPTQLAQVPGNGYLVTSVAINPGSDLLATGSNDRGVTLWDISDPQNPYSITQFDVFGAVSSLAFSPDGDLLAAGSLYYNVSIWNVYTYETVAYFEQGHGSSVLSIAFSPNGDKLASGSDDNSILIWGLTDPGNPTREELLGSSSGITSLKFTPDGEHLISGTYDNSIILWDLANPTVPSRRASMPGHYAPLSSVTFSPDGKHLASGGYNDTSAILWDAETNQQMGENLIGHEGAVMTVDFSPNGNLLASGSYGGNDPTFILWDVATHNLLAKVSIPHPVYHVAFSPDGNYLAVAGESNAFTLWDVSTPKDPRQIAELAGHGTRIGKLRIGVPTVAFSPDGTILASGGSDKTIILWDVSNPNSPSQITTLIGHEDSVLSVAFSPDGKLLVSGSDDNTLIVWDMSTYEKLITLKGHHKAVTSVAFSSNSKMIVSGSRDNTAILWDISNLETPYQLATLSDSEWINGVSISPDGKQLAGGGDSQVVVVWDIDPDSTIEKLCQRVGRNLTRSEWKLYFPDKQYPPTQDEATCPQWPLKAQ